MCICASVLPLNDLSLELRALEKELATDLKRGLKKELRREMERWRI